MLAVASPHEGGRLLSSILALAPSLAGAPVPTVLQGRWLGMTAALLKLALVLNVSVAAIWGISASSWSS